MGCGASSQAPAPAGGKGASPTPTVQVEMRRGDPALDELCAESPTLSKRGNKALMKRLQFEDMMRKAILMKINACLTEHFEVWAEYAFFQRVGKLILGKMQGGLMATAWNGWLEKHEAVLEKKRKEANAQRLLKRFMNQNLAVALDAWRWWLELEVIGQGARRAILTAANRAVDDAEEARMERLGAEERARQKQAALEDRSARYIQSRYRGRLARQEMKEMNAAASKIASNLKGRIARRKLRERKPGRGMLRPPPTTLTAALSSLGSTMMSEAQEAARQKAEAAAAELEREKEAAEAAAARSDEASAESAAAQALLQAKAQAQAQNAAEKAAAIAAVHNLAQAAQQEAAAAEAEMAKLKQDEARVQIEEQAAQQRLEEAKQSADAEALRLAEEEERAAVAAARAVKEAEERAKAEAERLAAEAEAARLKEEQEKEEARLQAEADERARLEAEAEAARLAEEAERKRLEAEAEAEARRKAEEAARLAAEAEEKARLAAKEEERRQYLLEDAARMQIYFGHTELVSQRMPGLVRDGGVCKEHFPDRDLEGRWTGAGLTKRVDFLSQIPLPPVRAADEEALAKAEKAARRARKKAFNALRWICIMLSERGGSSEVQPTPDVRDFVPGQKAPSLPPVPAIAACVEAGLVGHVLRLLGEGLDLGPENSTEQWQLMCLWILTNLTTPQSAGTATDKEVMAQRTAKPSDSGTIGFLVEQGALPVLIRNLDPEAQPSADVREHAVWVLGHIAAESIPLRDMLLEGGVLAPLLEHFTGVAKRVSSSAGMGRQWEGPLPGVLSYGETIEMQHWARRSATTLALLCTTRDETVTNQTLPLWAFLVEEHDERILRFALASLRMLSDGSLPRLKAVFHTRSPARMLTYHQREHKAAEEKRAQERKNDPDSHAMYEAMAKSPIAPREASEHTGVVDRLVELLDSGGNIKVQALHVISNFCVANSYVPTAQDKYVEQTQISGTGEGSCLKRLLQLVLSVDMKVSVMAVRVISNMLAGTTAQIGRVLDLDCTCSATPIGLIMPVLVKWLEGSAKAKAVGKLRLHEERAIGQSVTELEEAVRAICNASWSTPEHIKHLLRHGCLEALLTVLGRVQLIHGRRHWEMYPTELANHEDIADEDGAIVLPVVEALGNFLMFEEGADEAAREAAEAAHEEDKALDEGRKLPPGWKEAESATGEKMWVSEESGDVVYDFPRETEEQKMARRKKRKEEHQARMSKKTGGGNDVEKQRVRLQRAGFDKNVIDLMVQAHIEKSGGHLSIKDHILQLGRVWAEDMDVLEKPTMTELMTRTSTVLGSGTELFQSYLVHPQEEVREQVARFLKIHFGWSADEIQHETLHQQGILDHILAKAAAGSDEEGDRVPAAATPDHNAINQRGEQVYQMLGAPTDSPQYSQMTALLDERFEHVSSPFDDAIAAIRNGESP